MIVNITAAPDIGLDDIEVASSMIAEQADKDANIIWGAAFDESMDDQIRVTVIATGFSTRESYIPVSPTSKPSPKKFSPVFSSTTVSSNTTVNSDDVVEDIMSIFNK